MTGSVLLLFISLPAAHASWPEDVDLESMPVHDGEPVNDAALLSESYRQLVMELGTLVANKASTPAATLGWSGFDFDLGMQWILTEARDRKGEPSPWERAHVDEDSAAYHAVPTFSVRKGLPLSTEIGASWGWIASSRTGLFGGFARVAIFDNYKPAPDVAVKLGYSGYVGNDQIDCSALDLGVTVGSSWPVGRIEGVNGGRISPWASFTALSVRANPTIDEEVEATIGAVRYARAGGDDLTRQPPIGVPTFGVGTEFLSGNVHLRLSGSWAPATIPTLNTSVGFTF
jgi:hypothetical protein